MGDTLWGETQGRRAVSRVAPPQATTTAMGAILPEDRYDGMLCVTGTGTTTFHIWGFQATSTAAADSTHIVPADSPAAGRWVQLV